MAEGITNSDIRAKSDSFVTPAAVSITGFNSWVTLASLEIKRDGDYLVTASGIAQSAGSYMNAGLTTSPTAQAFDYQDQSEAGIYNYIIISKVMHLSAGETVYFRCCSAVSTNPTTFPFNVDHINLSAIKLND